MQLEKNICPTNALESVPVAYTHSAIRTHTLTNEANALHIIDEKYNNTTYIKMLTQCDSSDILTLPKYLYLNTTAS